MASRWPIPLAGRGAVFLGGTDIGDDENRHTRLSGALDGAQLIVRFGLQEPAILDHAAEPTPRLRQVAGGVAS